MTPTGQPTKYKAVAPATDGKPAKQAFGNCHNKLREWAQAIANEIQAGVNIYEMQDHLVDTVVPVQPDPPKTA